MHWQRDHLPGSTRCYQLLINSFDLFWIGRYWTHTFSTPEFYNFITKSDKPISKICSLINKKVVCSLAETCRFLCKTAEQRFFHCKVVLHKKPFFFFKENLCFYLKVVYSRFYKLSTDRFFSRQYNNINF